MKTYVMVPTYNEHENISNLIHAILDLKIDGLRIVVVDDNSPDGTADIVKKIGAGNKNVELLVRTKNKGRGSAGRAGFMYALDHGADTIIEMDADLSHNPKYIPEILSALKKADVVLGSRRAKGGKDVGRSQVRQWITILANLYISIVLGIRVKDCNSGYRGFTRKAMQVIDPKKIKATGPAIVQEVLYKAHLRKLRIVEIPIIFVDRTKGNSKLGLKQIIQGYFMILSLKWKHITGEFR